MTDTVKIWHRLEGETDSAFKAFEWYRTASTDRNRTKVAERLGVSVSHINNLAAQHNWTERVRAWDAHVAAHQDEATISEAQRLAVKQMAVWEDILNKAAKDAAELMARDDETDIREIVLMADKATEKLRLIVGEATERTETRQQIDLDALTPEGRAHLRALMDELGVDEI